MTTSWKAERSKLSHEEAEMLKATRQPQIAGLSGEELGALVGRVRGFREKERTLTREIRRAISGRKTERGSSFPGNVEQPSHRKQIFAAALKRLNAEAERRRADAAREAATSALRQALKRKNAAQRSFPDPGRTAHRGMANLQSGRRHAVLDRADVGRAVHTTKVAQAKRDARAAQE
jgi:hypothetical protein